jgi:hypothetical protein
MKVKAKEKKTVKSNNDTEKDKAKQNSLHSLGVKQTGITSKLNYMMIHATV